MEQKRVRQAISSSLHLSAVRFLNDRTDVFQSRVHLLDFQFQRLNLFFQSIDRQRGNRLVAFRWISMLSNAAVVRPVQPFLNVLLFRIRCVSMFVEEVFFVAMNVRFQTHVAQREKNVVDVRLFCNDFRCEEDRRDAFDLRVLDETRRFCLSPLAN